MEIQLKDYNGHIIVNEPAYTLFEGGNVAWHFDIENCDYVINSMPKSFSEFQALMYDDLQRSNLVKRGIERTWAYWAVFLTVFSLFLYMLVSMILDPEVEIGDIIAGSLILLLILFGIYYGLSLVASFHFSADMNNDIDCIYYNINEEIKAAYSRELAAERTKQQWEKERLDSAEQRRANDAAQDRQNINQAMEDLDVFSSKFK